MSEPKSAALVTCCCGHAQGRHVESEGWCDGCFCDRYRRACDQDGCARSVPCQIHGPFECEHAKDQSHE